MKERLCAWNCGRKTPNISGICDYCWRDREAIFKARMAREAKAEKSPGRVKAGEALAARRKARAAASVLK